MAAVRLSAAAVEDLGRVVITHSLPADAQARVKRSLRVLERFPRIGRELEPPWSSFRVVLGPWRWMLIVYHHDPSVDEVAIVTIQDGRSSTAVTAV